jgi:hypothetical protein
MADESNDAMPASQLVRWLVVGVLILAAVGLYFRDGRHVPPLRPEAAVPDTTGPR